MEFFSLKKIKNDCPGIGCEDFLAADFLILVRWHFVEKPQYPNLGVYLSMTQELDKPKA
jgi:hypothetical protein